MIMSQRPMTTLGRSSKLHWETDLHLPKEADMLEVHLKAVVRFKMMFKSPVAKITVIINTMHKLGIAKLSPSLLSSNLTSRVASLIQGV